MNPITARIQAPTARPFDSTNPTEDEIIRGLADHFGAPEAAAIAWLTLFARTFDPKAAQERLVEREAAAG